MLGIEAQLVTGRYDAAAADDRDAAEWPPHPARVFCSLVAGARGEADEQALRWLEQQPPPLVLASDQYEVLERREYVVTNRREDKGGSQDHPARTNQLRSRLASVPVVPTVRLLWPMATAEPHVLESLRSLVQRVPYLGRSTSAVVLRVETDLSDAARLNAYESCELSEAESMLRVPYPGYFEALRGAHNSGRPSWEVSRARGYRIALPAPARTDATSPSPYTDLVILRFVGVQPDGRLATRFTEALRRAVMSRVAEPLPVRLHGHGADGQPHVAFLALPDVGHEHADGHLLGLAVAVPSMTPPERSAIMRGLLSARDEAGSFTLRVPHLGAVALRYQPGHVRPWGATPERWRRGAKLWVTATPVVLDRYPRGTEIEADLARSCTWAGLPEPTSVAVNKEPLQPGAVRLRPHDLPAHVRGRLFRHVALQFDRPVHGPVLLGAGRYLGVGLLSPADTAARLS